MNNSFFQTNSELRLFLSRFSCSGGYAVAGDTWISYNIPKSSTAALLLDLGGVQIC